MARRALPCLLAAILAAAAAAQPVHIPLDPAALGGAAVFTDAETLVARAAAEAGASFDPAPRPLPPQVILPLAQKDEARRRDDVVYFWRGDMLPDQMAPAESGTLCRRKLQKSGDWKTTRTHDGPSDPLPPSLIPAPPAGPGTALPDLIIETPYHLGRAGTADAVLLLWRSVEEGSAPLGGAIALRDPPPELADAVRALSPDWAGRADWQRLFDAFSP
jgi:hypothetical protein